MNILELQSILNFIPHSHRPQRQSTLPYHTTPLLSHFNNIVLCVGLISRPHISQLYACLCSAPHFLQNQVENDFPRLMGNLQYQPSDNTSRNSFSPRNSTSVRKRLLSHDGERVADERERDGEDRMHTKIGWQHHLWCDEFEFHPRYFFTR